MISKELANYLNYISTWETETDANINTLIDEQKLFLKLGDFNSDPIVDKEFSDLTDLAMTVRDLTIAADATQMAADAAAVAAIWSFGFGMAAFVALEATALIEQGVVSSKSKKLNKKLQTIDDDISAKINDHVKKYVKAYKKNNNLIVSKAPQGVDTRTCRSDLMQFMAEVQRKSGTLNPKIFRQYAESARIVYNSDEIKKVYDALDELDASAKTDADVKKFMNVLAGLQLPPTAKWGLTLVRGVSIAIMFNKLNIANKTIAAEAEAAGIGVEEVGVSAFEAMDAIGKFAAGVAVVLSVVDVVLNIINIVDVVEQCKKLCDELNASIKPKYKTYFNNMREASQKYKAAIQPTDADALVGDYECHKYDSGGKNDWHYVTVTKVDDNTYKWTNRANVSWTLTRTSDPNTLAVGQECPYYNFNDGTQQTQYTTATIVKDGDTITGIMGPWNELYSKS